MISPKRLDDLMQVDSKVIHNLALLKQKTLSMNLKCKIGGTFGILYAKSGKSSGKSYKTGIFQRSHMTF